MKVWLVWDTADYYTTELVGLFASRELAEAKMEELDPISKYTPGLRGEKDHWFLEIEEREVEG